MQQNSQSMQHIPAWIKNTAKFWVNGDVSDDDFSKAIEYLVNIGVITINIQPIQIPVTSTNQTLNLSNNLPILIGSGVNLKIVNSTASGTLTLNGKSYNAHSLSIEIKTDKVTLTGQIQGASIVLLEVTGVRTTGIEYNFNGVIINNGNSVPVTFTALLTNPAVQPVTIPPPKQEIPITTPQTPKLPMLMLTTNNNQAYMAFTYSLSVRIFDPQTNTQKIFDQFYGGIPDVNITVNIIDPNNKTLTQSTGKTDSKGFYEVVITMPYTQSSQEQEQVIINATKNGYTSQQVTLPLLLVRYHS